MNICRVIAIFLCLVIVECKRARIVVKKKPFDPKKLKLGKKRMCADHYFWDIVTYPTFVDKTGMIKHVFDGPDFISITAPVKFGKSANLDMLKTFLSVVVDDRGQPDFTAKNETRDYFQNLTIQKQDNRFFDKHFAQYAVIQLNFHNHAVINSTKDAANVLMTCIHSSYWKHEYICDSRILNVDDKLICSSWISSFYYELIDFKDIVKGVKNLAKFLFKIHKKKMWILVDDYDCIIKRAMVSVNNATVLDEIMDLVLAVLGQDGKTKISHVEKVVMTGNSYMVGMLQTSLKNVTHYGFLDDHPYGNYYGLTVPEADKLFNDIKFNFSREAIDKAQGLYDGYINRRGTKIYNTFSVMKFVNTRGQPRNFWVRVNSLQSLGGRLERIVEVFEIRDRIYKLLKGIPINVEYVKQRTSNEILQLGRLIKDNILEDNRVLNLFFSYLIEIGCFSFVSNNEVSIANREVGYELKHILDGYQKRLRWEFEQKTAQKLMDV